MAHVGRTCRGACGFWMLRGLVAFSGVGATDSPREGTFWGTNPSSITVGNLLLVILSRPIAVRKRIAPVSHPLAIHFVWNPEGPPRCKY
jgi:hypothetical protein